MSSRFLILVLAIGLLLGVAGCGGGATVAKVPTLPPVPTKTARPTFTHTPILPTATRLVPTATTQPSATPVAETPIAPSAPITPTGDGKALLTGIDIANVRTGPGTAYPKIGQIQKDQQFEVTGKNDGGDWWQLNFDGQTGWVAASMVAVNDAAANVAVAEAPAAPAPAPQPQPQAQPQPAAPAAPAAPAPTSPPPPPSRPLAAAGANPYPGNPGIITVRCRLVTDYNGSPRAGTLRVTGPVSAPPVKFGTIMARANTAMGKNMQYFFQTGPDCKLELKPATAGAYTAVILDDGGAEISDPQTFNVGGDQTEWLLVWNPR